MMLIYKFCSRLCFRSGQFQLDLLRSWHTIEGCKLSQPAVLLQRVCYKLFFCRGQSQFCYSLVVLACILIDFLVNKNLIDSSIKLKNEVVMQDKDEKLNDKKKKNITKRPRNKRSYILVIVLFTFFYFYVIIVVFHREHIMHTNVLTLCYSIIHTLL